MADEGKMEWDQPVGEYLPEFKLYDQVATERLTPRDLACHRSGLPRHDMMWYNSPFSREELLRRLRYLEPNEDFRAKWQYQNLMYMTARLSYWESRRNDMGRVYSRAAVQAFTYEVQQFFGGRHAKAFRLCHAISGEKRSC
ncbi:serine hydrolase domain-containing protein [Bacillus sonorensis]|nr:serine hydrolase domain-containing protein [Bacillus sonorensis]